MMLLKDILNRVDVITFHGNISMEVGAPCLDSRTMEKDGIFVAIKGYQTDGHRFINSAIEKGAKAIVCENLPDELAPAVTYVKVGDAASASGEIAANFYQQPANKLKLIGVTGTNGKTTIATLLFNLFRALGYSCGLLSTVRNKVNEKNIVATHTTPDVIQFNKLLSEMATAGCEYVFAEISSHAIHQKRIAGLHFEGGIFSNITHDHLDYHKTFAAYLRAKKAFFDGLPRKSFALTNIDDKNGAVMLQNTKARKCSYGLKNSADYKGKILENNLSGLVMSIEKQEVHFRLVGRFNAYNLLAVYGAATELGENKIDILAKLSGIMGAEGRFDLIVSPKEKLIGIIDYAHTPDALLNVLETINELRKAQQVIFTVVGCGGDRDKTKRPEMAQVAVENADKAIFTSDNPRTENEEDIIKDMESGVSENEKSKVLSITNRKEAIKVAVSLAKKEDIILIAGKGHEKYQEINGEKKPFDDKAVLREIFKDLNK